MIGSVRINQAVVSVPFRVPGQPDFSLEFVVDTGFAGHLTLPPTAVAALGLPFIRRVSASLANASTVLVNVHTATVVWNGTEREVQVLATGNRPLLGTLLLDGHELNIQFTDGGIVSIEPL